MGKGRQRIIDEIKAQWPAQLRAEWVGLSEGSSTLDGNFTVEDLNIIIQSMMVLKQRIRREVGH